MCGRNRETTVIPSQAKSLRVLERYQMLFLLQYSLTSADRLAEDVGVVAVVVAELELGDVERQIFGADFVECADNAALEDRPEAFNRVGVDR